MLYPIILVDMQSCKKIHLVYIHCNCKNIICGLFAVLHMLTHSHSERPKEAWRFWKYFPYKSIFLKNIWRRNVDQKINNNSPWNILRTFALFPSYFPKVWKKQTIFLEELFSVNGLISKDVDEIFEMFQKWRWPSLTPFNYHHEQILFKQIILEAFFTRMLNMCSQDGNNRAWRKLLLETRHSSHILLSFHLTSSMSWIPDSHWEHRLTWSYYMSIHNTHSNTSYEDPHLHIWHFNYKFITLLMHFLRAVDPKLLNILSIFLVNLTRKLFI